MKNPNWDQLKKNHDARVVAALSSLLSIQGPVELTAKFLSEQSGGLEDQCLRLLEEMAAGGILAKVEGLACAVCDRILTDEEARGETCPYCQYSFEDKRPVGVKRFLRDEPRTRDIIWMLYLAWHEYDGCLAGGPKLARL